MRREKNEQPEPQPILRQWGLNANVAMVTAVILVFLCLILYMYGGNSMKLTIANGKSIGEFDIREIGDQISVPKNVSMYPVEISRTAKSSYSIIYFAKKARQPYHWHAKHDFLIKVLAGRAGLFLLDRHLKMAPGDMVAVSAGTKYAIENLGKPWMVVLAVSTPPDDGKDFILSEEK